MLDLVLAAAMRPNGLDREVSALSASALLTKSPFDLIDPARAAAAQHLQQIAVPVWLITIGLQIIVLAWFWQAGLSAGLRNRLRALIPSEFTVRFVFGALIALLARLAAFIPQLVQYRLTRIMDLTSVLTRVWFAQWIEVTIIAMICAGLLAALILWLADRTHQWYLYTTAGILGATLLVAFVTPYVIAPLGTEFRPFVASPAFSSELDAMRRHFGQTQVPILEALVSRQTSSGSLYVMGWGSSQRIVISDTLLAGVTQPELRFLIARQLAWVYRNDGLHIALIEAAFFVVGAALAIFVADRIKFRRDDDPVARLALVGALMGCVYLIVVPFYNGYSRGLDRAGDQLALQYTGDRISGIRGAVRGADQSLVPICPDLLGYWYFAPHPPPGMRITELQNRPNVCP